MILIPCPWCGPRNASEFHHLGERTRQPDPRTATREQWRSYLYLKDNRAGWVTENWLHRAGCRQFFTAERHTVSNEIRAIRLPARDPELAAEGGGEHERPVDEVS
jgi:heterotetrameric sarcosine oxidase delta subunit